MDTRGCAKPTYPFLDVFMAKLQGKSLLKTT